MADFLVMAFPAASDANLRGEFATLLGELAEVDVGVIEGASYERLAVALNGGQAQLAWLSPIPYIALSAAGAVTPLVYNERAKKTYCAAIIVRSDSPARRLADLKGSRAAWVDRHSAAGFVVPRIQLAAAGLDPRTELGPETFAGSHEAVVRMVEAGEADFGATYAHRDESAVTGPWSPGSDQAIRALATFGKIPSDLIVARNDLDMKVRLRLVRALRAMNAHETGKRVIHELFDVERFRLLDAETYDSLRSIARDARDQGLLDGPPDTSAAGG
jgi:phosphate/phosphite/phosphonate ABC transporter binding protein